MLEKSQHQTLVAFGGLGLLPSAVQVNGIPCQALRKVPRGHKVVNLILFILVQKDFN